MYIFKVLNLDIAVIYICKLCEYFNKHRLISSIANCCVAYYENICIKWISSLDNMYRHLWLLIFNYISENFTRTL